ncbi:hypothetical protein SAY86_021222 [Trapa natans]|uniref:HTH myb-type domain-containing protein n=1 Tax=Trapa natans TaxID=22666 RepID=A0AAN7RFH4_TRANT|nr:hypothetical protein SAY86_021222 [Trapa natans]
MIKVKLDDILLEIKTTADECLNLSEDFSKNKYKWPLLENKYSEIIRSVNVLKSESVQFTAPSCSDPATDEFIPLKEDSSNIEDEGSKQEGNTKDQSLGALDLQLCTFQSSKPSTVLPFDLPQDVKAGGMMRGFPSPPATVSPCKEDKVELHVHSLSLLTRGIKNFGGYPVSADARVNFGRLFSGTVLSTSRSVSQQQSARKQRRCWSPELNRLFVNALQQLGGAQAATPKKIRQLMQVDGPTNDEVKSYLQKYRLQTQRPSSTSGSQGLYGDQSDDVIASKGSNSQSRSPQGPMQLGGSAGDVSITGGDNMEDDKDSKSESINLKIHASHLSSS